MRDELLTYYERELTFVRQMGTDFAHRYPKVASRLALEPDQCQDPHVERLLEGFALLAGRIHLKLDDDFPEITQALLNVVYPHYLRPVPSMSIAEFEMDPEQLSPECGIAIPAGASLATRAVEGLACRFRTCFDLAFWPVTVDAASWREGERAGLAGAFRIELRTPGELPFSRLALDSLRFHINGHGDLAQTIYELVSNSCARVTFSDGASGMTVATLPPSTIHAVGFEEQESALPYPARSFSGYRILQEYFAFPQKFLFFELTGLRRALSRVPADRLRIELEISPFERAERRPTLEAGVSARTFRLGCSPIVNLFPHTAEPIPLDHSRPEYPVVPDASRRRAFEIFSVEEVLAADPRTRAIERIEPFYALRHNLPSPARRYWQSMRRALGRQEDPASEVWLSFVKVQGQPAAFEPTTVTVRTLCSNADLPSKLPVGDARGDFELEGPAPVKRIVALVRPTPSLRPPVAGQSLWRLISQLSLNYLSLVEDGGAALRELLRLYDFGRSPHTAKQIEGIVSIRSRRRFAPLPESDGVSFARGTQVEMEFDEQQFVGGGVFLFAAVLERFLGQYVSMNSFCQLEARTRERKGALRSWPPRAGKKVLI
jgi:type VI secretion system protein ImpG